MIRETLPDYLKEYYNDIDNMALSKVETLKKTNYLLFTLTLYRLTDMCPINGLESPIYVYYLSTGKKRPTVNCTDILGGTMKWKEEEKKAVANYPIAFINAIACVLFKRWNAFVVCTNNKKMFDDGDTPENFEASLKNIAYNNIQAVKFIKTLEETDVDKIYTIGVSLGALTMAAIYGIEDSYKKAVIILGGYPLTNIIASSDEGMVKNFYNRMFALYGTDADEAIHNAIANSEEVFKYIPKNTTLLIGMATGDTSVPSEYQKQLAILIEPKEMLWLKYRSFWGKIIKDLQNGHYQTLLFYPYLVYRSLKYLGRD